MNEKDFENLVKKEIAQEQQKTCIAAISGIILGLAAFIGPLVMFWRDHQPGSVFIYVGVLIFIAPVYIGQVQKSMKDQSNPWLSEFLGYFGVGACGVGFIILCETLLAPLLQLASYYEDQGRPVIMPKLSGLMQFYSRFSPFMAANMRLLLRLSWLKGMFKNGDTKQLIVIARDLVRKTEKLYTMQPTAINHECLCVIQSIIAGYLAVIGYRAEASVIWNRVKSVDNFDPAADANRLTALYDLLAFGAVRVQDYQTCLSYCKLAREYYQKSNNNSKVFAGEIALNGAKAHLELGNLDEANKEIENCYQAWHTFLNDTAVVMADVHYIKGRIELAKENYQRAADWFNRALTVKYERGQKLHPETAQILEAYVHCLEKLGQSDKSRTIQIELTEIRKHFELPVGKAENWQGVIP